MSSENNKSSYWYSYSPVKATTNEIIYVGKEVSCIDICTNSRLTTVQEKILDKICELVGATDATVINVPECLKDAWDTQDETILNFIQFLLDQHCVLKEYTDTLPTTSDPIVTLTYCCCNDNNGCNTEVTLSLSAHIQKVLDCLCALKTQVDELQTDFTALSTQVNGAGGLVSQLAAVKKQMQIIG